MAMIRQLDPCFNQQRTNCPTIHSISIGVDLSQIALVTGVYTTQRAQVPYCCEYMAISHRIAAISQCVLVRQRELHSPCEPVRTISLRWRCHCQRKRAAPFNPSRRMMILILGRGGNDHQGNHGPWHAIAG